MPIMFNTVLLAADFNVSDVRLLRHKDGRSAKGRLKCSPLSGSPDILMKPD